MIFMEGPSGISGDSGVVNSAVRHVRPDANANAQGAKVYRDDVNENMQAYLRHDPNHVIDA